MVKVQKCSPWRLVAGKFLGGWKRVCGRGKRFREQPSVISTNSKSPVTYVLQGQAHADFARRPGLTPTRDASPCKAAADCPRSPPAAAPVETNHCRLTNHLSQMWQESALGYFSHTFLPNSLSGFSRQAKAISALQTTSYYPE